MQWRVMAATVSILLAAVGIALSQGPTENVMKADYTIFLDGDIAKRGGALFIQPTAVDADDAVDLTASKHSLTVSAQVSIVRLSYPKAGSYEYRFRSLNEREYPVGNMTGGRFGVGQAWDYHPDNSSLSETIETVISHHISTPGGNWEERKSHERSANLPMGFLRERYACIEQGSALVCDATGGNQQR